MPNPLVPDSGDDFAPVKDDQRKNLDNQESFKAATGVDHDSDDLS